MWCVRSTHSSREFKVRGHLTQFPSSLVDYKSFLHSYWFFRCDSRKLACSSKEIAEKLACNECNVSLIARAEKRGAIPALEVLVLN